MPTKALAILAPLILLAACAAPLDPAAQQVRQIAPPAANDPCKFLGVIDIVGNVNYWSVAEARRDMLARVRNEVAKRGGNAYVPTATIVTGMSLSPASAQADAYSCP